MLLTVEDGRLPEEFLTIAMGNELKDDHRWCFEVDPPSK